VHLICKREEDDDGGGVRPALCISALDGGGAAVLALGLPSSFLTAGRGGAAALCCFSGRPTLKSNAYHLLDEMCH
jgi:hypothetical protein